MNIFIIPEDHTNDQLLLRPIFERLFASFGHPRAKLVFCQDPKLRGVSNALNLQLLRDIIDRNRMVDLFILCVDRDGNNARRSKLDHIESALNTIKPFIAEHAWQEIEAWALAGLDLPSHWNWSEIRAEVSVKEKYFNEHARSQGISDGRGGGRLHLGKEAAKRLPAIRQKCPEFELLATRIAETVSRFR